MDDKREHVFSVIYDEFIEDSVQVSYCKSTIAKELSLFSLKVLLKF